MENQKQPQVVLGVICAVLTITVLMYKFKPSSDTVIDNEINYKEEQTIPIVVAAEEIEIKKEKFVRPKYPHCIRNDSGELYGIVTNIVFDITTCDPSEKLFNTCAEETTEGRSGIVVVYTAVSLLLISLLAAAIEVYRVRSRLDQTGTPTPTSGRDPPQLTRRCSLADLTVLRHNRRESMLRRDSIMHMSVDSGTVAVNNGGHHQRVPLKLLGSSKSQDDCNRRSSAALAKACKWQRSVSADKADESVPDVHHHRIHMIRHH